MSEREKGSKKMASSISAIFYWDYALTGRATKNTTRLTFIGARADESRGERIKTVFFASVFFLGSPAVKRGRSE